AEDGIRDDLVTGVQTCALPICFAKTLDISALQVRSFSDQLDLSLGQVTAVGEVVALSDPRFDQKVAEDGLWRPFDFLFKGRPGKIGRASCRESEDSAGGGEVVK